MAVHFSNQCLNIGHSCGGLSLSLLVGRARSRRRLTAPPRAGAAGDRRTADLGAGGPVVTACRSAGLVGVPSPLHAPVGGESLQPGAGFFSSPTGAALALDVRRPRLQAAYPPVKAERRF